MRGSATGLGKNGKSGSEDQFLPHNALRSVLMFETFKKNYISLVCMNGYNLKQTKLCLGNTVAGQGIGNLGFATQNQDGVSVKGMGCCSSLNAFKSI